MPACADVFDRVGHVGDVATAGPARRCGRRRSAARTRCALKQLIGGVDRPGLRRRRRCCPSADWRWRRRERCGRLPGPGRDCSAASGLTSTRTAGSAPPPTITWPTPCTCESFCCRIDRRGVVHLRLVVGVRRQRQDHDRRVGRIDLAVGRIARQVGRQLAAGRVDGGLHVARGGVDVAVQIELQRDRRRARASWSRSSR